MDEKFEEPIGSETSAEETQHVFRVTGKPADSLSNLEAQANAKAIQDAVAAQRRQVENSASQRQSKGFQVADLEACQSIEAKLSDGRIVKMQEPTVALQFKVDLWYDVQAQTSRQQALAIMHVVEIDGDPIALPTTKKELDDIANRLRTRGLNDVFILYQRHFAGIVNLQVLKKNI